MAILTAFSWMLSGALIGLTLLPLLNSPKWWIRVWDYPRLQVAVGLIAVIVAQITFVPIDWARALLLLATLGCLGWQVFQIYPYTWLHRVQSLPAEHPDSTNTVSLLVANVLQDNRAATALLQRIAEADPDIVLVVETNAWWDRQIADLTQCYPCAVRHPLENTYGMHLFSRLVLGDVKVQERVTKDIPSIFARVQLRSGRWIDLYCVHPEPPQPANDVEERDAELLLVAKEVARSHRSSIVFGDLNDVAWSHTTRLFQRISGLLDPRIGRGFFPTFHAEHWLVRWPLDHVFHDASFRFQRMEVLGYFGSDHFPIYVELVHDPGAVTKHEVPAATAADHEEAAEKIAEGREAATED